MSNLKDIMTEQAWKHEEEVTNSIEKAVENNDVDAISKMLIARDIILRFFEDACGNGDVETVRLLVQAGIGIMNKEAILRAAYKEKIEILEIFISAGVSKQFMQQILEKVILDGKVKTVEFLLKNGLDPESQMPATFNLPGERYVIFATKKGYDEIVDLLIKYGADIYNRYLDGEHPLIIATVEGHTKVVKVLLDNGLSVKGDEQDIAEKAMKIAKREGFTEIVELLEKREYELYNSLLK